MRPRRLRTSGENKRGGIVFIGKDLIAEPAAFAITRGSPFDAR
jgi:hypothetical protein